ncbi:hypothetical protein PVAG01_01740 [Phlyctema vagabunda]|uniref:Chitin-binding type-1 domain-containing protein n=1 Tax=Phlyctema vagabunda TaxID=108571 RepID=A0ABR4PY96_9HELO
MCTGSTFGDCCSLHGFCGKSMDYCGAGCQVLFGSCSISTDGACGSRNGMTCVGSTFGNCCSSAGFCGGTADHCGVGCQKASSSACLTTNIPSVDGTCGDSNEALTCAGGSFDNQCCSSGGFCGTTAAHCGSGCQKGFGRSQKRGPDLRYRDIPTVSALAEKVLEQLDVENAGFVDLLKQKLLRSPTMPDAAIENDTAKKFGIADQLQLRKIICSPKGEMLLSPCKLMPEKILQETGWSRRSMKSVARA